MARYFRCRTNPTAPLLKLDMDWEADEMKTNHDYDEVDADGLPVVVAEPVEHLIPFQAPRPSIR